MATPATHPSLQSNHAAPTSAPPPHPRIPPLRGLTLPADTTSDLAYVYILWKAADSLRVILKAELAKAGIKSAQIAGPLGTRWSNIPAQPPLNISGWSGRLLAADVRWRCGAPPVDNANCAWSQIYVTRGAGSGIVDARAAARFGVV